MSAVFECFLTGDQIQEKCHSSGEQHPEETARQKAFGWYEMNRDYCNYDGQNAGKERLFFEKVEKLPHFIFLQNRLV